MSPICPCDSLYKINSDSDHYFCGSPLSSDRGSCPRCCRRHVWRPQNKLYPPGSDGTDSICHLHPFASMCILYDYVLSNYNYTILVPNPPMHPHQHSRFQWFQCLPGSVEPPDFCSMSVARLARALPDPGPYSCCSTDGPGPGSQGALHELLTFRVLLFLGKL